MHLASTLPPAHEPDTDEEPDADFDFIKMINLLRNLLLLWLMQLLLLLMKLLMKLPLHNPLKN